ncbi:toxic anion resistance protein TelA family protein [Asticcacaulis biprosthecium C19]|uniref:Toxic anion resistance protein TelA family protein n=1 Tax=Asticcacaulis biprosthecium C19 TaxID=715226 RepID=F4QGW7_9CAUL|nr:toxic anion resistance protein [Asticcacaulis biprosthecium]EGF93720.1 toxic anion resistance protein TelA family protein [Asticcacaulis biprosthecium C19]
MSDLVLEAPAPVAVVPVEKAAGLVPIETAVKTELESKVDSFVTDLVSVDANSPEFGGKVNQLNALGQREITALASQSNRFLDRPTKQMEGEGSVGGSLIELRHTIEGLDPSRGGALLEPRKLFGFIPFGNKLKAYFDKYQSAQSHINAILVSLARGKDELLQDNVAIDGERRKMWEMMGKLEQVIHISKTLDGRLEEKAAELDASDPTKARAIRESALFYVRQRTTDLLTQMAVTVQGYLALDLIKKNNIELIKGVERASTTTIAALRTAVTVAQALASQKLVLDQITALNTTTSNMIASTSELLKSNTARIHEQATSATIHVETLQRAFANIYATMDAVDEFKIKALSNMKTTVDTLSHETEKAKGYIARAQGNISDNASNSPLALS